MKRYDEYASEDCQRYCCDMVLSDDGDWVLYDDAAAELERLRQRVAELEGALHSIKEDYEFCRNSQTIGRRDKAYYDTACAALASKERAAVTQEGDAG